MISKSKIKIQQSKDEAKSGEIVKFDIQWGSYDAFSEYLINEVDKELKRLEITWYKIPGKGKVRKYTGETAFIPFGRETGKIKVKLGINYLFKDGDPTTVLKETKVKVTGKPYHKKVKQNQQQSNKSKGGLTSSKALVIAKGLNKNYRAKLEAWNDWKAKQRKDGDSIEPIEAQISLFQKIYQFLKHSYSTDSGLAPSEIWEKVGITESNLGDYFDKKMHKYWGGPTYIQLEDSTLPAQYVPTWKKHLWRDFGFVGPSKKFQNSDPVVIPPSKSSLSMTMAKKQDSLKDSNKFLWLGREVLAHQHEIESAARQLILFLKYGFVEPMLKKSENNTPASDEFLEWLNENKKGSNKEAIKQIEKAKKNYVIPTRALEEPPETRDKDPYEGAPVDTASVNWWDSAEFDNKQMFEALEVRQMMAIDSHSGGCPGVVAISGNNFLAKLGALPFDTQIQELSKVLYRLSESEVGKQYLRDLFVYNDEPGMINPLNVFNPAEFKKPKKDGKSNGSAFEKKLQRRGWDYLATSEDMSPKNKIFKKSNNQLKNTGKGRKVSEGIQKMLPDLVVGCSLFLAEALGDSDNDLDPAKGAEFLIRSRAAFTSPVKEESEAAKFYKKHSHLDKPQTLQNSFPGAPANKTPSPYGSSNSGGSGFSFQDYVNSSKKVIKVAKALDWAHAHGTATPDSSWAMNRFFGESDHLQRSPGFTRAKAVISVAEVAIHAYNLLYSDYSHSSPGTSYISDLQSLTIGFVSTIESVSNVVGNPEDFKKLAVQYGGKTLTYADGMNYLAHTKHALRVAGMLLSVVAAVGAYMDQEPTSVVVAYAGIAAVDMLTVTLELAAAYEIEWAVAALGGTGGWAWYVVAVAVTLVATYMIWAWKDTLVENYIEQTWFGIKWGDSDNDYWDPDHIEYRFKISGNPNYQMQRLRYNSILNPVDVGVKIHNAPNFTFTANESNTSLPRGGAIYVRPIYTFERDGGPNYDRILPWLYKFYVGKPAGTKNSLVDKYSNIGWLGSRIPIYPRSLSEKLEVKTLNDEKQRDREQLAFANFVNLSLIDSVDGNPVYKVHDDHLNKAVKKANNMKIMLVKDHQHQQFSWDKRSFDFFNPSGDPVHDWTAWKNQSTNVQKAIEKSRPDLTENLSWSQGRIDKLKMKVHDGNLPSQLGIVPRVIKNRGQPGSPGEARLPYEVTYEAIYVPKQAHFRLVTQGIDVNAVNLHALATNTCIKNIQSKDQRIVQYPRKNGQDDPPWWNK